MSTRGKPGQPGEPGRGGGGAGGPGGRGGDSAVSADEWHRWKRRSLAAWLALGLATTGAFYVTAQERADRIDQAATVIRVRCEDSRANRQAIRVLLAIERRERDHGPAVRRALERAVRLLPPVQDCPAQARAIRGLVD